MKYWCVECGEELVSAPVSLCIGCAIAEGTQEAQTAQDLAEVSVATFVDWRAVSRNVASISEEATGVFHRQVKAHTLKLVDALDALPPGIKAYLLVQDREIKRLAEEVQFCRNRLAGLPSYL